MARRSQSGAGPFYRLVNAVDHFYTMSAVERDAAIRGGYHYEGIAGYLYRHKVSGSSPLYRSLKPSTGDHFYTTSWAEAHTPGYHYEGVAGYIRVW